MSRRFPRNPTIGFNVETVEPVKGISFTVWDVGGLHVADAASLPSNTGVNPQITIMANALRVAETLT